MYARRHVVACRYHRRLLCSPPGDFTYFAVFFFCLRATWLYGRMHMESHPAAQTEVPRLICPTQLLLGAAAVQSLK